MTYDGLLANDGNNGLNNLNKMQAIFVLWILHRNAWETDLLFSCSLHFELCFFTF